jgi:PhnB protein
MEDIILDAYLFFAGDAKEAMGFYKSIFGGKIDLMVYDEVPGEQQPEMKGKVIHALLSGGDIRLMASDSPYPDIIGTGKINISLSGQDKDKLSNIFDKLSAGGTVKMPLKKEFWGDTFGMLTDKYDVDWMINISAKNPAKS